MVGGRSWTAPALHPAWEGSWPVVPAGLAGAAGLGALYALASYGFADARLLPVVAIGFVALALGLWRLEYGLALIVLVTPFAENAPISQPSEARLRIALIFWAIILVVVQAARSALSGHPLKAPPILVGASAFLAAALASVLVAENQAAATAKFFLLAGSVLLFLLISTFLDDWRRLKPVLAAVLAVGLVISAHALYQYATGDLSRVGFVSTTGTVEYRISSFFPHPNQLAGFLVLFVPLGAGLFRVFESRLARAGALLLPLLALPAVVLTYSRGALVALVALVLVYAKDRRAWPLMAAAGVLVALLAPAAWQARVADVGKLDQPEIATRLDFWDAGLAMFQDDPVLGVGLNNFDAGYVALERAGRSFVPGGTFAIPETAHSSYVNTLAEQGLVGAAALVLLALAVAGTILRLRRAVDPRIRAFGLGLLGAALVLVFHNVFDVTFVDPKTSTLVWTLLGVGAALVRIDERERADAAAGPAAR